jgi:polysaccharide export outer membrane protein
MKPKTPNHALSQAPSCSRLVSLNCQRWAGFYGFHFDNYRFILLIFIFSYVMVIGCAGPVTQIPPDQAMPQIQKPDKQLQLQNQILGQISQTPSTGYKDYAVGSEDLLTIAFYGQDQLGRDVRVNGHGEITLPLVGVVQVTGLSPHEIENRLIKLYKEKRFIKDPQIMVSVKEYRHQRVMITGAVNTPGSYEVIGPRTLLEMLGRAGGLNDKAGNVVEIVRHQSYSDTNNRINQASDSKQPFPPGSDITVIDLDRLMTKGAMELNVAIKNGDVIHVPFANNAYVLGAVNRPGSVVVKNNLTVTQAIAVTGGINSLLASGQCSVIRFDDKGQRIKIPINIDRVSAGDDTDILLKANDVVYVQESGFKKFLYNFRTLNPIPVGAGIPVF